MTSSVGVLLVASLVAAVVTSASAVTCYLCSASSRDDPCGNPFNATAVREQSYYSRYNITCDGVCVSQVRYTGAADEWSRTCSMAHPSDGCYQSDAQYTGQATWICIKTCTSDYCNTGSTAAITLPPPSFTVLVMSSVLAVFSQLK